MRMGNCGLMIAVEQINLLGKVIMSIYKNILNGFTWSFSRLTSYEYCPYSWYQRYIENGDGIGSFYAENGSAMHEIFDGLVKGKIKLEDAPSEYLERFNSIKNRVNHNIMDNTFESCINYLCTIQEDILDDYEIIASELEVNFKVKKYKFTGFIDLLLRDKDGSLIIVDHKSAEPFLKKDGSPYAKARELLTNYTRQLSLYSIAVKKMYGEYPTKLVFHHFKNNGELTVLKFDELVLQETIDWAVGVIKKIYKDEEFLPITKTGFCYRLCNYRRNCAYKLEDDL